MARSQARRELFAAFFVALTCLELAVLGLVALFDGGPVRWIASSLVELPIGQAIAVAQVVWNLALPVAAAAFGISAWLAARPVSGGRRRRAARSGRVRSWQDTPERAPGRARPLGVPGGLRRREAEDHFGTERQEEWTQRPDELLTLVEP